MLKHYILSTLRHLCRKKIYSFITLLSLTIGLSVFTLIFLHVKWEFSYNKGYENSDRIYRVMMPASFFNSDIVNTDRIPVMHSEPLVNHLDDSVSAITQVLSSSTFTEFNGQTDLLPIRFIGRNFHEVFPLEVTQGDLSQLHDRRDSIAISEEVAQRYFGDDPAVGRVIRRIRLPSDPSALSLDVSEMEGKEIEVVAVYRLPEPVTDALRFYSLVSVETIGVSALSIDSIHIWLKRKSGISEKALLTDLQAFNNLEIEEFGNSNQPLPGNSLSDRAESNLFLEPAETIYFNSATGVSEGNLMRVVSFAGLGLMVLLAGCTNAVSLGFAGALERSREVGIRKSVGSSQLAIILQFLAEPILLSFLVLLPVLIIAQQLHPAVAEMLSFRELPRLQVGNYVLITTIVLLLGLIIGVYPAYILSRINVVEVLKPQARQPGTRIFNLRSFMVTLQYVFALGILIVTAGLYTQLFITSKKPLGFNAENLALINLIFYSETNTNSDVLVNILLQEPGIESVAAGLFQLFGGANNSFFGNGTRISKTIEGFDGISVQNNYIPYDFFSILETPVIAGREFDRTRDRNNQGDVVGEINNLTGNREPQAEKIIISRTTANALLYPQPDDAIGQRIYLTNTSMVDPVPQPLEIIGVVEDSMFRDIRARPVAEYYRLRDVIPSMSGLNSFNLFIRYDPSIAEEFQTRINEFVLDQTGSPIANYQSVEVLVRDAYQVEKKEGRLLLLCGSMALILACVGLYGLVSITMNTRIKEIGVRKVLGADSFSIIITILKKYLLPIAIAHCIAWPTAIYMVFQWIERFPYQLEKYWIIPICLLTSLLVLLIAWVTVSALTYKTASAKPVLALRYE